MKNLFLALCFTLATTFSFASHGETNALVMEDFGTCTITVTETDSEGNTTTTTYQGETNTAGECETAAVIIGILHVIGIL